MNTSSNLSSPKKRTTSAASEAFIPNLKGNALPLHPLVNEQMSKDIWILLLVFRCVNAVCVRTFFQPDEYFQSLEPAWQMAFGQESGAWITWEWHHHLRSSLHPALFAIIYFAVDKTMQFLHFFPQFRAMILSVLPNLVQAYLAAAGDYYTWQLSEKIYGVGSNTAWATLVITMLSPWQWFCSTRTFSNCLETTMTITALNYWPWRISTKSVLAFGNEALTDTNGKAGLAPASKYSGVLQTSKSIKHLRISLLLAGTACILRPTNTLIWFSILMPAATNLFSMETRLTTSDYLTLLREALLCGSTVLLISAISDKLYFQEWTFPPYQWLNFNISQDLAVFYGRNDWHYYISQGLPLLLTTYLPFTLIGLWKSTSLTGGNILSLFATTILVTLSSLSLISHKEVRFISPLLPLLHLITAPSISSFFLVTNADTSPSTTTSTQRKPLLALLITLNLLIAGYTTLFHQRGVLDVLTFLRSEYESLALDNRGISLSSPEANAHVPIPKITNYSTNETFVGFLMPCHSTPWRSQLIYPDLKAWALGCEPPIHLAPHTPERIEYRDEADRFYDDPLTFLKTEINTKDRPWPRYIVGFEGIEQVLGQYYETTMIGFRIRVKWRGQNSHWHDDARRRGNVVVWEFVEDIKMQPPAEEIEVQRIVRD